MATNTHDDITNLAPVAELIDRVVRQPIRDEAAARRQRSYQDKYGRYYSKHNANRKPWCTKLPGKPV